MRRGMPTSAEELSYSEKKVLLALGQLTKARVVRSYRLARPNVAKRALPERKALKAAIKASGKIPVPKLKSVCKFNESDLAVALGWLRRKGWAEVSKGPAGSVVIVTPEGKAAANGKGPDEILLRRLPTEELTGDAV